MLGTAIRSDRQTARAGCESAQLLEPARSGFAPAVPSITDCLDQLESLEPGLAACLPGFLVISPPKTGSTWLACNLGCHPGVFVPECKEVDYFSSYCRWLDLDWYLRHFRDAADLVRGEASPSYSILPVRTIRLIRMLMPDLKLIFLMRDPVGRAWSHARHNYRYRETNFANCTEDLDAIPETMWRENFVQGWTLASGDYLGQLRRWMSVFPKEQIYVGFYESIARDPESVLRDVLGFLNVEALDDLSSLPISKKILGGLDKKLPPNLLPFLQDLLRDRTAELAAFLGEEFSLTLPEEWQMTLQRDSPARNRAAEPCISGPHFQMCDAAGGAGSNAPEPIRNWERSDDDLDRLLRNHAQCIGRDWARGTPKNVYLFVLPDRIQQVDRTEAASGCAGSAQESGRGPAAEQCCFVADSCFEVAAGAVAGEASLLQVTLPDYALLFQEASPKERPRTVADDPDFPAIDLPLQDDCQLAGAQPQTPTEETSPPRPEPPAVKIEYAGWLPVYRQFGNCGSHPQFAHVDVPLPGYEFERSDGRLDQLPRGRWWRRPLVRTARTCNVAAAMARLYVRCRLNGVSAAETREFLRSRDLHSQLLLPRRRDLVFVTSVPFTYGQHPWVIEIEDVISLFFPFVHNGQTAALDIWKSPGYAAVKTLLEAETCRAIVTHMKATAEGIPRLFGSERITAKTVYIPMGVHGPEDWQRHEESETVNLLFTNSWHQGPNQFYLRGGLDVLEAFAFLRERCPQLRLILRTRLPDDLPPRYREIVAGPNVQVLDEFLPAGELDALRRSCHVYLLPSARIHIVSVLQAMSFGLVPVVSDGWGMPEYVDHGHNGLVLKGRYGKVTWTDERMGLLREDYRPMYRSDPGIVRQMVAALTALVENRALRQRLGAAARNDIEGKFNLTNWNLALKNVFDRALSRNQ